MKKLFASYFLVFVFGFALFLYEPITMYFVNIDDISLNFQLIIKPILLSFFLFLVVGISIFTMIYFINKKYYPNKKIFEILFVIIFILFLCLFIEGNYMIGNLPQLDGADIFWKDYIKEDIISTVIWLTVIFGTFFLIKKFSYKVISKYIVIICLFAFFVSLCSLSIVIYMGSHSFFERKTPAIATTTNYNLVSKEKNFYILLLDAVDSVMFDKVVQKNKYQSIFDDFTYYKDTTSTYVYTRDSVPFILSGEWNYNEKRFREYSTEAMDQSYLIELLKNNNYNINLFSNDVYWDSNKSKDVSNMVRLKLEIDYKNYLNEQRKYVLYKYLPFPLKMLSDIESLNYNNARKDANQNFYDWKDILAYENFNKKSLEKTDEKVFKFIHIEGAHVPFNLNKEVELVKKGKANYYDKLEASIKIIDSFLKQLKKNDAYDNSAIIIMSDHGYALGNGYIGRQNPIFFVKGVDEHHELLYSDKKVSYTDLNDLYEELISDKKGNELFSNVSNERERTVLIYKYSNENEMVEFRQIGNAWNEKTMIPSGKKYDLYGRKQ